MVAVHELVKPVNGVLQDLLDQDCQPQTVELREEAGNDRKAPRDLAELGLKASVLFGDVRLYLVEGQAQVLKEDLLDQHIDFPDGLQDENQKEETAHVSPKKFEWYDLTWTWGF